MTKKDRKNLKKMGFNAEEIKLLGTAEWKQHCAMQKKQFGFSENECLKRELEMKKLVQMCHKNGKTIETKDIGNGLQITVIK